MCVADYICDEEDLNVIEQIRDSTDGRTVVKVDGHVIDFYSFKCLLNPNAYLDGEVNKNMSHYGIIGFFMM